MNEVVVEQNVSVVDVSCVEEVEARLLKEGVVGVMPGMVAMLHRVGQTRARSCALDGVLWRALKYAPERRAHSALCREKDRERET